MTTRVEHKRLSLNSLPVLRWVKTTHLNLCKGLNYNHLHSTLFRIGNPVCDPLQECTSLPGIQRSIVAMSFEGLAS